MAAARLIVDVLAALAALWWVIGLVLMFVFGYLVPLSIYRIARNTRKIADELERLNDRTAATVGAGPLKLS